MINIKADYTSYSIDVPMINWEIYRELMNNIFPEFDVNDYDIDDRKLYIGINYETEEEHEKLLKKLIYGLENFYRK